jgi:hypothetical protein
VHEWLLRHVYLESINTYKTSRLRATFITFLLSAVVRIAVVATHYRSPVNLTSLFLCCAVARNGLCRHFPDGAALSLPPADGPAAAHLPRAPAQKHVRDVSALHLWRSTSGGSSAEPINNAHSMRVHACRRAGNFFFWFGLILGVPLLATVYCREYYYALSLKDNPHIMLGNV